MRVKLLNLAKKRDDMPNALRTATVKVQSDGETVSLVSATYLPPPRA